MESCLCGHAVRGLDRRVVTLLGFLVLVCSLSGLQTGLRLPAGNEPLWAKCITRRADQVLLTCPTGQVIYRPTFMAGARAEAVQDTCAISDSDCLGQVHDTEHQVSKCYWRRSCKLTWRERAPIVTSSNDTCVGRISDYVIFTNAPCIPTRTVIDICEGAEIVTSAFGIIRSHDAYPQPSDMRQMTQDQCRKILEPDKNHTLVLHIDDVSLSSCDVIQVLHVTSSREVRLMDNRMNDQSDVTFAVTSGQIVINYVTGGRNCADEGRGFLIRFEQKGFRHQDNDLCIGETAAAVAAFGDTRFNVKAAVSRCVANPKEEMTLRCPSSHVIFQPEVLVGVAGWERRCHFEYGDCEGQTHTLVVQRHQCHWQQACSLSWRRDIPILKTEDILCMVRKPDYVKFADATCLPIDAVVDLCEKSFWHVNGTHIFIRSHSSFPWNYDPYPAVCRKRIRVHRKYGLRILSRNLDLDPNLGRKRDNLKLWKVTQESDRTLANVFHGNDVIDETFEGGCVDVEFQKSPNTNGGAGFVLKLETLVPVTEMTDDFHECGDLVSAVKQYRAAQLDRRNSRGRKKTPRLKCKDNNVGEISAAEFAAGGEIKLGCNSSGLISDVSLIGHNGSCRGVPPDLYVQVLTCYWKNNCTLNYSSQSIMKVLPGSNVTLCVWALPDTFTLQYECTESAETVKVFDVRAMEGVTGTGKPEVTEVSGVIRSHDDHPWLYRHVFGSGSSLTLKSPNKTLTSLVFTVRSLSLWDGDIFKVHWKGNEDGSMIFNGSSSTPNAVRRIDEADKVTFTLSSSSRTAGGDGFVICFKWIDGQDKTKDACIEMFKPGQACGEGDDRGGNINGDTKKGKKGGKKDRKKGGKKEGKKGGKKEGKKGGKKERKKGGKKEGKKGGKTKN